MIDDAQLERHRLRADGLTWRESADGRTVVLDHRRWVYLNLNGSGARLWAAMAHGASLPELARLLEEQYGIDARQAQHDATAFVATLEARGLLAADGG